MVTPGYLPFHPNPKKPDAPLPAGACDSHCHVFGPADVFPFAASSTYEPVDAPKEKLFELHQHLGIERSVIVQASCHGTDNAAMVDALISGGDNYKGVAVVSDDVSASALAEMHDAGVRGVRFNFVKRLGSLAAEYVGVEMVIFKRINENELELVRVNQLSLQEKGHGTARYAISVDPELAGVYEFGFRIYPHHPLLANRQGLNLVHWV